MIKLQPCSVVFDEIEHTYTYGDKQLSGVTSLLSRQLFKDKYSKIREDILQAAAERGNRIHRQIEMYESFGSEIVSEEVNDYIRLKAKNKFTIIATEWLVSDYKHVASSIDNIFGREGEKGVYLWDTKTTSSLDKEYLSWQLSIYKYLFMLDNPDVPVLGLGATWLPDPTKGYGRSKMVSIEEKPMEWVKELIECDARGEQWEYPEAALIKEESALVLPLEMTEVIADFLRAEQLAKTMKEKLRELMEEHGIKKWENDVFSATIGQASTSTTFDSKAFAKADPDTYEKFLRTTEKKGSFSVKLKQ